MLPRTLEPEVMDTAEEAADYDAMDHSAVNRVFVSDFVAAFCCQPSAISKDAVARRQTPETGGDPWTLLDVGTGTALIPIELVRQVRGLMDLRSSGVARSGDRPHQAPASTLARGPSSLRITAIDLADEMIKLGRINIERAACSDCITLEWVDAKRLPYADGAFDAVMSNSIVHHIPEPRAALAEMWRVLRPGGLLFVRDLLRPETSEEVEWIVATYTGNESPRQQQLFRQSLHAALTVEEVSALLSAIGIERVRPAVEGCVPVGNLPQQETGDWSQAAAVAQTSDRHWTIGARRPA